jgi:plastocyanin domain-containing protein
VRPTSVLAIVGLGVIGIIIADFLIHPEGTKQAANGIVSIEKPAANALLGSTS